MGVRAFPGPEVAPYRDGNLMDWVSPRHWRDRTTGDRYDAPDELRPNDPFWAELTLISHTRGRSAAGFKWLNEGSGCKLPMFLSDAADLMRDPRGVQGGKARGWWVVIKRGQGFGIMRMRSEQEPRLA